jgi:hypothetical protein
MAQGIRVENYKSTVIGLIARWASVEITLAVKPNPGSE